MNNTQDKYVLCRLNLNSLEQEYEEYFVTDYWTPFLNKAFLYNSLEQIECFPGEYIRRVVIEPSLKEIIRAW